MDEPERVVEEHHIHLGGKRNVAQPQSTGESAAGNLIHVTHHHDLRRREIALNQALDAPQSPGNGSSRLLLPRPDPLAGHTVACRRLVVGGIERHKQQLRRERVEHVRVLRKQQTAPACQSRWKRVVTKRRDALLPLLRVVSRLT